MVKKEKNFINKEHRGGMLCLSEDIGKLAQKILGSRGMSEIQILAAWQDIVGTELATYSLPLKIDFPKDKRTDGVLHLACSGGAYALELQHRTPFIIEKVNTFFGYQAVAKIKINQNHQLPHGKPPVKAEDNPEKMLVTKDEENYIKETAEQIQNPELRARIESLGKKIFGKNK